MSNLAIFKFNKDCSRGGSNPKEQKIDYNLYNSVDDQDLYEQLKDEEIQLNGLDCIYMPRTVVNLDLILGEDLYSKFEEYKTFPIKLYFEEPIFWGGPGELIADTDIQYNHEAKLLIVPNRFKHEAEIHTGVFDLTPKEGDLIKATGLNHAFLMVNHVETEESNFFHRGRLYTYKLTCEKYTVGGEEFFSQDEKTDELNDKKTVKDDYESEQLIDGISKDSLDPILDENVQSEDPWGDF